MTVHDLLAVQILETSGGLTKLEMGSTSRRTGLSKGTYQPQRVDVWVVEAVAVKHRLGWRQMNVT